MNSSRFIQNICSCIFYKMRLYDDSFIASCCFVLLFAIPSHSYSFQDDSSGGVKQEVEQDLANWMRETQLILLSKDNLERVKKNSDFTLLIEALIEDGENALDIGPYSVTYNKLIPVSNNTNDYFSVGPYWWPDSNKINGLPWIRRDGEVNKVVRAPNSDSKQLSRVIDTVKTLGLAYYFSGDNRYSNRAEKLLRVFFIEPKTKMNPHLNFAQSIPGKTHGRGIGIIEARQLVGLLDGITLMQRALSPSLKVGLDEWLTIFLGWLVESPNGQDEIKMYNNHGTYYDVIITSLALYLDMPDIAKYAVQNTKGRIKTQINDKGEQAHELKRTRPFHYSVFNLMAMINMAIMADKLGINLWQYPSADDARILKAWQLLANNIGDSDYWDGKQEKNVEYNRLIGPTLMLKAFLNTFTEIQNKNISVLTATDKSHNFSNALKAFTQSYDKTVRQTVNLDESRSYAQLNSCSVLFNFDNESRLAAQQSLKTTKYKACVY